MGTDEGVRVRLRRHGAEQIAHPGGNLYANLCRPVADRHGTCFGELLAAGAPLASEQVLRDAQRVLRP
ncbi:hypothetical protein ACGF7U_08210 [Micromonospora sp. NPDC047670]|uniref:hypothetical protein n=1 Tax=Micromonospora sp. NPDC047670 TaxID=3364252 RepID=UPI0037192672